MIHQFFPRYVTPQDAVTPCAVLLISAPSTYAAALVRVLVARKGREWTEKLIAVMALEASK